MAQSKDDSTDDMVREALRAGPFSTAGAGEPGEIDGPGQLRACFG